MSPLFVSQAYLRACGGWWVGCRQWKRHSVHWSPTEERVYVSIMCVPTTETAAGGDCREIMTALLPQGNNLMSLLFASQPLSSDGRARQQGILATVVAGIHRHPSRRDWQNLYLQIRKHSQYLLFASQLFLASPKGEDDLDQCRCRASLSADRHLLIRVGRSPALFRAKRGITAVESKELASGGHYSDAFPVMQRCCLPGLLPRNTPSEAPGGSLVRSRPAEDKRGVLLRQNA